jgi:hypothetical protein
LSASKQRGWVQLLSFLPYILGALALAGTLYAGYRWYHNLCNDRCRIAEQRATLAEEAIKAAQARASHLALLWADAIQRVERVYVERQVERSRQFSNLRERAGAISNEILVPIPVPHLHILRDAAALAGTDSAAPQGDSGASEAVPASAWTAFAIDAAAAYADARDKHQACVAWANSITEQQ